MNIIKIKYFINWGVIWRMAIIFTGAIMLLYAPVKLNTKDLALFYAIYASYAAISLLDFGLTNRIFVSGYHKTIEVEKKGLQSRIYVRFLLIALVYIGYGYVVLGEVLDNNLVVNVLALTLSAVMQYASLLKLSYIDGCIDNRYSYLLRTVGEVGGCITLVTVLYLGFTYSSIYALMIARALPTLIISTSKTKNRGEDNKPIQFENNFSMKIGLVMALGYLTSTGLINIIHWIYNDEMSAAYSQLYLLQSTLFTLCMSVFLYHQKSLKDKFIEKKFEANELIAAKKESVIKIQMAFTLLSLGALVSAEITKLFGYAFIKFGFIEFIMLYIFFVFLINNHVSTIIFRIKGVELTFRISITSGVLVLVLALLFGYLNAMRLFLFSLAVMSYIFNVWVTNSTFERNAQ